MEMWGRKSAEIGREGGKEEEKELEVTWMGEEVGECVCVWSEKTV